jgi:putative spermidine/putrescine transport system substrate-binding protein
MISRRALLKSSLGAAAVAESVGMSRLAKAAAPAKLNMTIYSGVQNAWDEGFGKGFTAKTGNNIQFIESDHPRTAVQSTKGMGTYDLALGGYYDAAYLLKDGLIETFSPEQLPFIKDLPSEYVFRAPDGRIAGVGVYFTYFGIAYNNKLVKADDFSSWTALADPKWKGRISLNRPSTAAAYDLPMLAKVAGGDERDVTKGYDLIRAVVKNSLTPYSSMSQMSQLLDRGEVVAGSYYLTRVWAMKGDGDEDVDITIPKEGALLLPYLVMVPKGTKQFDAALSFLEYASTPEPQIRAMDVSGYVPLNPHVQLPAPLIKQLGMSPPELLKKLYSPDWNVIADHFDERLSQLEQIYASAK